MPLRSGDTFAGSRILRLLGSGGMGEVYLAQHPRLPRRDALKILPSEISADEDFRSRFEREADLASTLWHPHIVGVHDRGESNGQLWISMDFVDRDRIARSHVYVFVLLNKPRVPVRYFIVPGSELLDHPEKFGKEFGNSKIPGTLPRDLEEFENNWALFGCPE